MRESTTEGFRVEQQVLPIGIDVAESWEEFKDHPVESSIKFKCGGKWFKSTLKVEILEEEC